MALEMPSDSDGASGGDKSAAARQFDEDLSGLSMPPPSSPAAKMAPSSPQGASSPGLGSVYSTNAICMIR